MSPLVVSLVLMAFGTAGAAAQSAGDRQYADPLAGAGQQQQQSPSAPSGGGEPNAPVAPSSPTTEPPATATPTTATPTTSASLPRTGADPAWIALLGLLLLTGGTLIARRTKCA